MKDLSLHLMDIAQNSVRANASKITIKWIDRESWISLVISDNGKGMDAETLQKATDPFFTSRTRRKVGLGLPLLEQSALQCEGNLHLYSEVHKGTKVVASFKKQHPDCPPIGNLAQTLTLLMIGHPNVQFTFSYQGEVSFWETDSQEIRQVIGPENFHLPKVVQWIQSMIHENLAHAGLEPQ